MIPLAIGFGLIAIKAGRQWVDRQVADRLHDSAPALASPNAPAAPMIGSIVVATARMKFGAELTPNLLREAPWPDAAIPKGAFAHLADILGKDGKRFALSTMEEGEAILASRITGPGQRPDMASVIEEGKRAFTVRIDDVAGVAGFVLPGDRVDVMLMRAQDKAAAYSDILLQGLKVLAIDQLIEDRTGKPTIARTVTLEVSTDEAQRLIVAQSVGGLSLVLRPVGEAKAERVKRVGVGDLIAGARESDMPTNAVNPNVTVGVTRGFERKEYAVPLSRGR